MYQSCSNASGWYGVVAWTLGVIPTSKSSAGHPPPVVGLPVIAITFLTEKKRGKSVAQNGKRDGEIVGQRERKVALSCLLPRFGN